MFSHKKSKLQINADDPVFQAVYLGKIEIPSAKEPSCVTTAVGALWERAHKVGPEKLPRISVALGPHGISIEDIRPNTQHKYQFGVENISYCMANKGFKCVFAWVVAEPRRRSSSATDIESKGSSENEEQLKSGDDKKPRCHAVICEREEIARIMALLMTAYFNVAYHDHKSKQKRETRKQATRDKIDDLETRLRHSMLDDDDSPSTSRPASRQSSTRSTNSSGSEHFSPIHKMVAKAFGVSPKALSDPDAVAMQNAEQKLRTLRVDPGRMKGKGEMESVLNWVSKSDAFY